jgi:hypothetical protein
MTAGNRADDRESRRAFLDACAAVGRSIYLQMNARLQAQAIALGGEVTYLAPEEARKIDAAFGYERAWELWKRKLGR